MNIVKMGDTNFTNKKNRMMSGQSATDSGLTAQQEINAVIVEIVNRLKVEIEGRSVRRQNLRNRFSFLQNLNSVSLEHKQERQNLRKNCLDFANYYGNDVAAVELYRVSTKCLDNLKNLLILQLTLEMSEMFK